MDEEKRKAVICGALRRLATDFESGVLEPVMLSVEAETGCWGQDKYGYEIRRPTGKKTLTLEYLKREDIQECFKS